METHKGWQRGLGDMRYGEIGRSEIGAGMYAVGMLGKLTQIPWRYSDRKR